METNNIVSRVQARTLNSLIGENSGATLQNVVAMLDNADGLLCGFGDGLNQGLGIDLIRQCRCAVSFEASTAS